MASVLYLFGRCSPKKSLASCQKLVPMNDSSHGFPQISLTFIRWRKPRWLPKAPSKIYYVRKPTPIDPVEYYELQKLYNVYRSEMKSVRSFLVKWSEDEKISTVDMVAIEHGKKAELAQLLETNRLWNEDVAKQREERQSNEAAMRNEELQAKLADSVSLNTQRVADADQAIRREKELVGTFITPDILDDEIEKMLNSRKDYNFAINSQGDHVLPQDVLTAKGSTSEQQQSTEIHNERKIS